MWALWPAARRSARRSWPLPERAVTPDAVILADDLTGACDAAAPFASAGRRTRVSLDPGAANEAVDVVAYDLDVRDSSPEQASQRVGQLAQRSSRSNVHLLVKIDSTLRGPVVELCRAALEGAARAVVVVAPAFPAQGRTLVNGRLAVAGAPASGEHGNLLERFARAGEPSIHVPIETVSTSAVESAVARAMSRRIRAVIVDAESDMQLASIAEAILNCAGDVVVAGSGGIAHAMAGWHSKTPSLRATVAGSGPVVVFAGSPAYATRRQVNQLSRQPHTRVVRLNDAAELPSVRTDEDDVLVVTTCPEDESSNVIRDEARSAGSLAAAARHIARQIRPRAVILAGGASARAVCTALGVHALDLDGEALSGLPRGVLRGGTWGGVPVMTKSGGFGAANLLSEAVHACRACKEPV